MPAPRAAQAAPTPLAPVDGATVPLDTVTFRWSAPPGPTAFTLRVAAASAPDAPLVELTDLSTTEATLADALPPGPSVWWVRRDDGPWSQAARFVAGTPADVELAQTEEAANATQRREAERVARLSPRMPDAVPEAPPAPVWPHASGPALDGAPPLDWSSVAGFTDPVRRDEPVAEVASPRPLSPLGGEIVDAVTVTLRWAPAPDAVGYDVELSPHATFDRDVLTISVGPATEVTLPGLSPAAGHRLLWRVRARTSGDPSAWSEYGRFYPAPAAAVDQFRQGLDAALLAARKQREHERLVRERELELVPLHERPDAVTDTATLAVLVGMMLSGVVIGLLGLVFALVHV